MNAGAAYARCLIQALGLCSSEEPGYNQTSTLLNAHLVTTEFPFISLRGIVVLCFIALYQDICLWCPKKLVYGSGRKSL